MSKLIVGLGNPGPQYAWTRHNLGFLVLGALNEKCQGSLRNSPSSHGWLGKIALENINCSLLMPTTFMNRSGLSVKTVAGKQGIGPEDILVITDDMSLPFGKLRLRPFGSAGGHNGLKSIIADLGTNEFPRLRMGIGAPQPGIDPADYVLSNFTSVEKKSLTGFINHALDCVTCWVTEGAQAAMNQFNKTKEDKE